MRRRWNSGGPGAGVQGGVGGFAAQCRCDNPDCVDFEGLGHRLDSWSGYTGDELPGESIESAAGPGLVAGISETGTVALPEATGARAASRLREDDARTASGKRLRAKSQKLGKAQGPRPGRCEFFLEKKNRFCSMRPAPGKEYCGVHEPLAPVGSDSLPSGARAGKERVPCPIDPRHTIFKHDVAKHLKVCVFKTQQEKALAQPYFHAEINSGPGDAGDGEATTPLKQLPRDDPVALSLRVAELFEQHVGQVEQWHLEPAQLKALVDEAQAAGREHDNYRHSVQQASILRHMRRRGLLEPDHSSVSVPSTKPPVSFVEFGAGRGMLSLAVRKEYPGASVSTKAAVYSSP